MAKRQCSSCQMRKLIAQYDGFNLQAHSAYMNGRSDQTAHYYLQAFEISAELLALWVVNEESIRRCVEACLNCFEYGPHPSDVDEDYLEVTGQLLSDITQGKHEEYLKSTALEAYAEVARLAHWTTRHSSCASADAVVADFNQLWRQHAPTLIGIH